MVNLRQNLGPRLQVLLTEDYPLLPQRWTDQLLRFFEPQGVAAYVAQTGREAIELAERMEFHAAVIDLSTPLDEGSGVGWGSGPGGGMWLLELFRRLPNRPPVVVVSIPTYTPRQLEQLLREALRLGVFSVVNKPVDLEQMLTVFQRLVDRQYRGCWPVQLRPANGLS